jgi:hypothetical protein
MVQAGRIVLLLFPFPIHPAVAMQHRKGGMTGESADGRADFDFGEGDRAVCHRRLATRLAGADAWQAFPGTGRMQRVMGALAMSDKLIRFPGGACRALALCSFGPATGLWAIWRVEGRRPHAIDVPVQGRFVDGVGRFTVEDSVQGRPVLVAFRWSQTAEGPRWQQALSPDAGATWEVNRITDFRRV